LIENELVHLFVGTHDGTVHPNPHEVHAVEWLDVGLLRKRQPKARKALTPWFRLYLRHLPHFVAGRVSRMAQERNAPMVMSAPLVSAWEAPFADQRAALPAGAFMSSK
jgi:hypothetical protein